MRALATAWFLLALGGCAAGTLLSYRLAQDWPRPRTESLTLPGLAQPVRVSIDPWGVPHVEAHSTVDLVRAVGFLHGRDRFFQMDMLRRLATGTVAALVGEARLLAASTVDFDRSMRGWEMEERARTAAEALPPDERALLQAYADGVTAAARRHPPLEHRLLRVEPEPWRVADTFAVGLLTAWSVSHNWQQELARFLFALSVGVDRAEAVYPSEPLGGSRTLEAGGTAQPLAPSLVPEMRAFLEEWRASHPPAPSSRASVRAGALGGLVRDINAAAIAGASNAWVVAGTRSVSGKPMLANDPHLSHLLPSLAYQQHLRLPDLDVIGMTIPGIPWVLAGHNARVAWGMTSTVADVMDLVVERPDPRRAAQVLREGSECALAARPVRIAVRDGEARNFTLRRTCSGPVLNDMFPELFSPDAPLVAVRWATPGLEESVSALARANRARSVDELRQAVARLGTPVNTFTTADVDGRIGSFLSGTVPLRRDYRGTFPVPGWSARYAWDGLAAHEALPAGVDPASGFLVHANNLMVEPGSSTVTVNIDAAPSYRYDRIVERIAAIPRHDVDSLAAIQADAKALRGRRVMPRLLEDLSKYAARDTADTEALAVLEGWDLQASAGSPGAAVFFATYRHAVLAAVGDELPRPALLFFVSQRYSTGATDGWFDQPDQPVWDRLDTARRETRADCVRIAFARAVDELKAAQGPRPATWRWGRMHVLAPRHPFGGKALLAGLVNLEAMEAKGELDTVWKSHFDMGDDDAPFKVVAGPVFRTVVDLADLAHGRWVVDTGSSGWPGSPHYGDQYLRWRSGELVPMLYAAEEVRREAVATVTLVP